MGEEQYRALQSELQEMRQSAAEARLKAQAARDHRILEAHAQLIRELADAVAAQADATDRLAVAVGVLVERVRLLEEPPPSSPAGALRVAR